jgi:hypothetical protein
MTRKSWIYTPDGRCIEKGTPEHDAYLGEKYGEVFIAPDEPDFVSPIDGKVYSGKAGMRDHNRRHDVVNNRDLAGLPWFHERNVQADRRQLRSDVIEAAKRKGHI